MKTTLAILFTSAAAILATSCGVEAGNPGDKPKTGSVRIQFGQSSLADARSLKLAITGAELRSSDESQNASLALASDSIELVDSGGGEVLGAESDEVPAGEYSRLHFELSQDRPLTFQNLQGEERIISLDAPEESSFYIDTQVVVEAGGVTDLEVVLDPRRSLIRSGEGLETWIFRPHGAIDRHRTLGYVGTVPLKGATVVCAYRYDAPALPELPAGLPPPPDGPAPTRGPALEMGPTFATAADVEKDTKVDCDHAFATADVADDGTWRFQQLPPGTYDFRAFVKNDDFKDVETGIKISPMERPPKP